MFLTVKKWAWPKNGPGREYKIGPKPNLKFPNCLKYCRVRLLLTSKANNMVFGPVLKRFKFSKNACDLKERRDLWHWSSRFILDFVSGSGILARWYFKLDYKLKDDYK